ncbi:MAG: GGDEF domain-containing protein [Bacteroidota bacterium]
MAPLPMSSFLLGSFWTGWRRWAAWVVCLGTILLLGGFRLATDARLLFASSALLPVLAISWIEGRRWGLLVAFLAAGIWSISDFMTGQESIADWIPWTNSVTRWLTYSLFAILIARLRQQFEQEHQEATLDHLTGLLNRRAFLEVGENEARRSERYKHPMAVVFLDLDDFKKLNDTKGHDAGDAALQATARGLIRSLRAGDQVARLGGDEFAILLPEIDYEAAVETGRKISHTADEVLEDFPPVKESIGVAWFEKADRPFQAMLKAADELMYEVKNQGKDNIRSSRFVRHHAPDGRPAGERPMPWKPERRRTSRSTSP